MSNKNKKQKKQQEQKKKTIMVHERADGINEVVITKAPSKTILGKIVIVGLAAAMVFAVVFGLIVVLIQAA